MSLIELFIVAVALSMDAFAVSICKGLSVKRAKLSQALIVGAYFGGFQALMPAIGYVLGTQFASLITSVDHWIAFVLLGLIGGNMIRESLSCDCCDDEMNDSFNFRTMLPLAVATSIDALATGVTCSSSKFTGVYRVFQTNFLFNSDFRMDLLNFHVNGGNFRMCLVNNGKIIAEVEPGMATETILHDLNGSFELVIAGESADFTFYMDSWFCEQYNITVGE